MASNCVCLVLTCVFVCASSSILGASEQLHDHVGSHVNRGCQGRFFDGLGCFSTGSPFNNTGFPPRIPNFNDTTFLLYTSAENQNPEILNNTAESIRRSHFNAQLKTKFLVHGFLQNGYSQFLITMRQALLHKEPMNVIVVGWGGGAWFPYTQAVANTRVVGAQVAQIIDLLMSELAVSAENIHIIGHSLGAHIAGYAGHKTPGLGRITGLDPAQPNYHGFENVVRLDPSDAMFVDVIHTDAIPYDTVGGYGMIEPVGDIDFYPNGGKNQPDCLEESSVFGLFEYALYSGVTSAEKGVSCSHERSTELFTASISSQCGFTSFPCESEEKFLRGECLHCGNKPCPSMGYHADVSYGHRGKMYLNTTGSLPFCGYHFLVSITLSQDMEETSGQVSVKLTGDAGSLDWSLIFSGDVEPGSVMSKLLLSPSNIGQVQQVDIKFDQTSSYFQWSGHELHIRSIKVNSAVRSLPKYFCGQSTAVVENGHPLSMSAPTFRNTECA